MCYSSDRPLGGEIVDCVDEEGVKEVPQNQEDETLDKIIDDYNTFDRSKKNGLKLTILKMLKKLFYRLH